GDDPLEHRRERDDEREGCDGCDRSCEDDDANDDAEQSSERDAPFAPVVRCSEVARDHSSLLSRHQGRTARSGACIVASSTSGRRETLSQAERDVYCTMVSTTGRACPSAWCKRAHGPVPNAPVDDTKV